MTSLAAPAVTYDVALVAEDMAAKGFLQTDLATRAGLSPMVVSRFMRRERQTARTAKKIARCLGYSVRRYIVPTTPQRRSGDATREVRP